MQAGVGQHATGAEHRLGGEQVGDVARQADADPGIRQRLGDDGQKRRTRAAERGDRVQVALGQHDRSAERAEESQRRRHVLLARRECPARVPPCHSAPGPACSA